MMTLDELASALPGARVIGDANQSFSGVSIDSRQCDHGRLFFALRGDRRDGHDFVEQAKSRGASAVVVDRPLAVDMPQVIVADTRLALGMSAAHWRKRFNIPLIAVAGSNGKTTVTQMISSILVAAWGPTNHLATHGNWNNDIGVPLMLWRLNETHRAAVLELGMNHPGEMQPLAKMVRPTIALITNAQREHQAFLGNVESSARENGAVIESLPDSGVAIFPADDPHAHVWREVARSRTTLDFALEGPAQVTATYQLALGHSTIRLRTPAGPLSLRLPMTGLHHVRNALAAAAAAVSVGISEAAIVAGLERFEPVSGRGVVWRTTGGALVIDESYNANPDSMRAAIATLAQHRGPRVLIVGDMFELGESQWDDHAEIGTFAATQGIEQLFGVGALTEATVAAFRARGGLSSAHFGSMDLLIAKALEVATRGATILVKGSRGSAMEQVVAALSMTRVNTLPVSPRHDG